MQDVYLEDSYLQECEATITKVTDDKYIVLDKTVFYPNSGGQPHDTGTIKKGEETYNVIFTGKFSGDVSHEVDKQGLKEGDKVTAIIDWERRYAHMKCHTAAHILSELIHKETGALITGNQLGIEKCRIDFSLDDFHPEKMKEYIDEANEVIQRDLPVTVAFKSRQEAMQLPQLSKLAKGLPESLQTIRIVAIGDFDVQGDGGTHVKSTKEIGKLEFIKCQNKGKNNRRLYFRVV